MKCTNLAITQDGKSVLMIAAKYGHSEVVVELIKAKANLDLRNNVRHAHHQYMTSNLVITQDGESALMIAAKCGHSKVVVELVKAKANLDLQNNVRIIMSC